eukprot:CAMPEP_0195339750 /NCGR_PEP_ID=MMETSP0708-20121125/18408_1 /TAXON_ID=33640 /ORGANISM="Asterionellopsis glacialis, Strain CCMP134" /LENGTH=149 /DNA_ID=CAMNT_0040411457 /DNA_START=46 /DNA_END=495 /DNA_ORIENTATION=+
MKVPVGISNSLVLLLGIIITLATAQELRTMNAECHEDVECETGHCYYGFQIPGSPGHCKCNLKNHSGCPDGRRCIESTFIADIPPLCALPLHSPCQNEMDCESGNCAHGICQCNHYVNTGCNVKTEICRQDEDTGNYNCYPKEKEEEEP